MFRKSNDIKKTIKWTIWFGIMSLYLFPLFAAAHEPFDQSALMEQIKVEAVKKYEAPIDARLDSIWKAVPGYNGVEVDIERTYEQTKKANDPTKGIQFVFREIPPAVKLDDLGAHPIFRGNPAKPMAAIMINVAWGEEHLPRILETLEKEKVHCTFFFDGSWLNKHLETAKEIAARGHELSNHAYSHKNMSQISDYQARREIERTEQLLTDQLAVHNTLFAPPSGDYSMQTVKLAHSMKLRTILWTVDTIDWQGPPASAILRKISTKTVPGALILMHPTPSSTAALEGMIQSIKGKGLVLGTVSELISERRIPTE